MKSEPIVFVNKPIKEEKEDIIGIISETERIEKAIEDGANVIGIIGDYGSGKSSLIEMLKLKHNDAININMWNSVKKELGKDETSFGDLTKNFLFQLALGKNERFAQYINKKLSGNYGVITLGVSSRKFWIFAILAIISYFFYQLFLKLPLSIFDTNLYVMIRSFYKGEICTIDWIQNLVFSIYGFCKDFNLLFLLISILCIVIAVLNTTVVFSLWNSQGKRKSDTNDIYDTYLEIAKKIIKRNRKHCFLSRKKRIIIIEDLDRTNSIEEIEKFIKEIYKFNNVLPSKYKKNLIYIIAVKSEETMKAVKSEEIIKSVNAEVKKQEKIYPKIFYYKAILNPIHNNDCREILLDLLRQRKEEIESKLDIKLLEELPEEFAYVVKGKNLNIREIKDRLNRSLQLYENLLSKSNGRKDSIEFKKCTIVAYLESQYPAEMKDFINKEDDFSSIIEEAYLIKQDNKSTESQKQEKISKSLSDYKNQEFVSEIATMIVRGLIDEDFRMYFYNYPKGQRIKTIEEKYVEDILLYPNKNKKVIKEKVLKAIQINPNIISDCYIRRKNEGLLFPKAIFECEEFYKTALVYFADNLLELMEKEMKWKNENITESSTILKKISEFNIDSSEILIKYAEQLIDEFLQLSEQEIIKARIAIIDSVGKYIEQFKAIFVNDNIPLITDEELELIGNRKIQLNLIKEDIIDQENYSYIIEVLNKEKLEEDNWNRAKEIYYGMDETVGLENLAEEILEFLIINNRYDDKLFTSLFTAFCKNRDSIDKAKLCEYLNNLPIEIINVNCLKMIDKMKLDISLKDEILAKLRNNNLLYTYWLSMIKFDKCNMLELSENIEEKLDIVEEIFEYLGENIYKLRKQIISEKLTDAYKRLFFDDYPIISESELDLISDISELIKVIDFSKITLENLNVFVNKVNNSYSNKDELIKIIEIFDANETNIITDINIIEAFFEKFIWYENVTMLLTKEDKEYIYITLNTPLKLNNPVEALKFLNKIGFLIESVEKQVYSGISKGIIKKEEYINLINEFNIATEETINIIITEEWQEGLNSNITSKLIEKDNYVQYIECKTLWDNNLELETNKIDFKYYVEAYNQSDKIYDIMIRNEEFLQLIMNSEEYVNITTHEKLKPLYHLRQPIEFVKYLFENLEDEEIYEYLENEWHLNTEQDSIEFQRLICQEKYIKYIENSKYYYIVLNKLWKPWHKGQLTKNRKEKYGNMVEE